MILLAVVAAILSEAMQTHADAQPVARSTRRERVGEQYPSRSHGGEPGDKAASNVQVYASLEVDGETTEGDQVVDFLAGDDGEVVFVFDDDPDDGELTVEVAGFTVP